MPVSLKSRYVEFAFDKAAESRFDEREKWDRQNSSVVDWRTLARNTKSISGGGVTRVQGVSKVPVAPETDYWFPIDGYSLRPNKLFLSHNSLVTVLFHHDYTYVFHENCVQIIYREIWRLQSHSLRLQNRIQGLTMDPGHCIVIFILVITTEYEQFIFAGKMYVYVCIYHSIFLANGK